jgi:hypothetical protein
MYNAVTVLPGGADGLVELSISNNLIHLCEENHQSTGWH